MIQCETRGRKPGGHHDPATCERIAESMKESRRRNTIARRPWHCDGCGEKVKRRSLLERFRKKWLCGDCLNADMEPIRIEDYIRQPAWADEFAIDNGRMICPHVADEGERF